MSGWACTPVHPPWMPKAMWESMSIMPPALWVPDTEDRCVGDQMHDPAPACPAPSSREPARDPQPESLGSLDPALGPRRFWQNDAALDLGQREQRPDRVADTR